MDVDFLPVPKGKFLGKKENDYTPPPVPHCIEWDAILPQNGKQLFKPGLQAQAVKEDPGAHQSPTSLGGESTANSDQ